jgi:ribonuclease P protein component
MPGITLLKSEEDFAAFRKSRAFSSEHLKIRVHFRPNQNLTRFGFIVSKKTAPKAVDRNKLKRRLKSQLAKVSPRMLPADILMFPTRSLLKVKTDDLQHLLEKLVTDAKLWK